MRHLTTMRTLIQSLTARPAGPGSMGFRPRRARPRFAKHGRRHRLLVDGKPFLILGGELGNSTAFRPDDLPATGRR
jgi:hypothetical protein